MTRKNLSFLIALAIGLTACAPASDPGSADAGNSGQQPTTDGGTPSGDMAPNECVKGWQPGAYGWTRAWPDLSYTPEYRSGSADAVAVDAAGNTFVAGRLRKQADLDPTAGTDLRDPGPRERLFVTRVDADGSYGWSTLFESCVTLERMAAGTDGELVLAIRAHTYEKSGTSAGRYIGPCDIDPGPGTDARDDDQQLFLMRLGAGGARAWLASANVPTASPAIPKHQPAVSDLALDPDGTVRVLLGDLDQPFVLTPGPAKLGYQGAVVWKVSPDGTAGEVVPASPTVPGDAWLLPGGGVGFVGGTEGGLDLDPTAGRDPRVLRAPGMFVDVMNPDASYRWGNFLAYPALVEGFLPLSDGSFMVSGTVNLEDGQDYTFADVDPGPQEKIVNVVGPNSWLARWDRDGKLLWLRSTDAPELPFSMVESGDGQLLIAGILDQPGAMGGFDERNGLGAHQARVEGPSDGYVLKRRFDGTYQWASFLQGPGAIHEIYLEKSPPGLVTAVGFFTGTLDADYAAHADKVTSPGSDEKLDVGFFVTRFSDRGEQEPYCGRHPPETFPPEGLACGTCASQQLICGSYDDGCGHTLDCGPCRRGTTCGGISPFACARSGKVLGTGLGKAGAMALDGNDVYFAAEALNIETPPEKPLPYGFDQAYDGYPWPVGTPGGRLWRVPQDGSAAPTELARGPWTVMTIATGADGVAFVAQEPATSPLGPTPRRLRYVPKAGGPDIVLHDSVAGGPVLVSGGYAWTMDFDLSNDTSHYVRVPLDGSKQAEVVSVPGCPVNAFQTDGTRLYVMCTQVFPRTFETMLPDGSDRRVLWQLDDHAGRIAFGDNDLFVTYVDDAGQKSLRRVPKTATNVSLASADVVVAQVEPSAVYTDASDGLFAYAGPNASAREPDRQTVYRYPFGASAAESVAEGLVKPVLVRTAGGRVFWFDEGTGGVLPTGVRLVVAEP